MAHCDDIIGAHEKELNQEVPTDVGEDLAEQRSMKPSLMMTQGKSRIVMSTRTLGSLTALTSLKTHLLLVEGLHLGPWHC